MTSVLHVCYSRDLEQSSFPGKCRSEAACHGSVLFTKEPQNGGVHRGGPVHIGDNFYTIDQSQHQTQNNIKVTQTKMSTTPR